MHIDAYLKRIGYTGPTEPTAETLRALQRAHMMAVPFENLDIPMGYPITVSIERFYDKIVRRRRGGFCYELNGLFSWLLGQLGFDVTLLSARVFGAEGKPGPEFDHLTLLVQLEERLIADVGFGDFALEPLRLDSEEPVRQHGDSLRLSRSGDLRLFERRRGAAPDWERRYLFSLTPRRLEEYSEMCQYQQTSPESTFTKKTVCSLATPEGRITLTHDRLIMTADGERQEREIADETEYRALLRERFGVELDRHDPIHRLMRRGESGYMTEPERLTIGVACLIRSGPFLVLEVQKSHKWSRTPEGVRVGIGCIGGALEPGESPVEALQRECREEIGCEVRLRPAAQTWLRTRAEPARQVGWTEGGPRPALIWEGEGIPGGVVSVYLGEAEGEVSPADLPALLLAPPALVRELLRSPHTFGAFLQAGGRARAREAIPPEAVLDLKGTLAALRALEAEQPGAVEALLG